MPQFDNTFFISQLFWLAICFTVLYFFMARIYLPRIKDIIKERKSRIESDQNLTSDLENKIAEIKKDIEELRGSMSTNYKTAIDQAMKQAILNREEAIDNLRKKIAKINADSEKAINNFVTTEQNNCKQASIHIVEALNQKLFGGNLEPISIKTDTKN